MQPGASKSLTMLHKLAHAHANVQQGVACAGTSLESLTFCVGKKAFLFVAARDDSLQLRFKLGPSLAAMKALADNDPEHFEAGKAGWCKATFAQARPPSQKQLKLWIAESYTLSAPARRG